MKILLIAGHGDGDCGAVGNGYQEADLTREVVSLLKTILSNYAEVDIADTKKNWFEYLGSNWFNFKPYNYVLEVHFNAGGNDTKGNGATTGVEIYIPRSEKGYSVEENIVGNLAKLGLRNRHLNGKGEFEPKKKDFRVISKVKSQGVSSALLELCFIDDIDDMKLYQNKKNEIVKAIAKGIADGFGLKKKVDELTEACNTLAAKGIINSPDYWAKGEGYSDENTVLLIKKFAKYVKGA